MFNLGCSLFVSIPDPVSGLSASPLGLVSGPTSVSVTGSTMLPLLQKVTKELAYSALITEMLQFLTWLINETAALAQFLIPSVIS